MPPDLVLAERAVRLLQDGGFDVAVIGGWGEELRGLRPPGNHGDVDLLVLDAAADGLDKSLEQWDEIRWWGEHPVELAGFAISDIHGLPVTTRSRW